MPKHSAAGGQEGEMSTNLGDDTKRPGGAVDLR